MTDASLTDKAVTALDSAADDAAKAASKATDAAQTAVTKTADSATAAVESGARTVEKKADKAVGSVAEAADKASAKADKAVDKASAEVGKAVDHATDKAEKAVDKAAGAGADADVAVVPDRTVEEIEADLDATRERLAGRLDDLQTYVSPRNVADRQMAKVKGVFVDEYGGIKPDRVLMAVGVVVALVGIRVLRRRHRRD